ncbi:hypothetical protein [Bradyrhizobium liaoningense]|jgi:hypothetical protein
MANLSAPPARKCVNACVFGHGDEDHLGSSALIEAGEHAALVIVGHVSGAHRRLRFSSLLPAAKISSVVGSYLAYAD